MREKHHRRVLGERSTSGKNMTVLANRFASEYSLPGISPPALADLHRALAGSRTIPAQDDGGLLEENALAVGQPRDVPVIKVASSTHARCAGPSEHFSILPRPSCHARHHAGWCPNIALPLRPALHICPPRAANDACGDGHRLHFNFYCDRLDHRVAVGASMIDPLSFKRSAQTASV